MKKLMRSVVLLSIISLFGLPVVHAESVDTYIKQLRDQSAEVRARAAAELGAG